MPRSVVVARAEPGLLAHFPDAVALGGGRLLATWREGAGHVHSDGRIRLAESTDGGHTWGEPWTAVDGKHDDRDPKIVRLSDGTVLLSWFVLDWATEPHTNLGTWVSRSTDDGRSWSEPVLVGTAMTGGGNGPGWSASHGAAVELPGGELLLPIYGTLPGRGRERATVVRSSDGGRSWPVAGETLVAAADEADFQEPTLTVLGDGQLVALIRTTGPVAWLARSVDGGRTWSEPRPTDLPASSHHALALESGEVLVTYGDLSSRFSERRETVGRIVQDPAESWDGYGDVQLYDSGHHDQANPSSVEVEPGRFLTVGFDIPAAAVVGVFTGRRDYPG